MKGILPIYQAINMELTLCESIKRVSTKYSIPEYFLDNIRLLNIENNDSHKDIVKRLRNINNPQNLLND